MAKNILLSEAEFDDFQNYCRKKGFDLSYFSGEIAGSEKEIEQHQFDGPQVIKLTSHRFTFSGVPYTVAEWQQEKWRTCLSEIQEEFFKKRIPLS